MALLSILFRIHEFFKIFVTFVLLGILYCFNDIKGGCLQQLIQKAVSFTEGYCDLQISFVVFQNLKMAVKHSTLIFLSCTVFFYTAGAGNITFVKEVELK